jgi:hypothetical protein
MHARMYVVFNEHHSKQCKGHKHQHLQKNGQGSLQMFHAIFFSKTMVEAEVFAPIFAVSRKM